MKFHYPNLWDAEVVGIGCWLAEDVAGDGELTCRRSGRKLKVNIVGVHMSCGVMCPKLLI